MSTETITIISTGGVLLGTLIWLFRWLRQDIQALCQDLRATETRLNGRIEAMEARNNSLFDALTARIDAVNSRIDSLFNRTGSAA